MNPLDAIDSFANYMSAVQGSFLLAVHGLLIETYGTRGTDLRRFKKAATLQEITHMKTVRRVAGISLTEIAEMGGVRPETDVSRNYLIDMIAAQSRQSVASFANELRREYFAKRLGELAVRGTIPRQIDKRGRKGNPERFAYLVARKAALDAYNDSVYLDRRNTPPGLATVQHEDLRHGSDGIVLTPYPREPGEMTYAEARVQIFHPQARAIVT